MPRSVRILEGPLFGGTWIVAAFAETRIVLSGTRVAFGSPRSATIIRDWAVAAHTIIVLDRPVAVRYRTAIVDWSIAEAITGFTACTVVSEARILSGWCLTLVSDPRVVGNGRLLALWWLTLGLLALLRLALWCLTLIGESGIVGHRWLVGNRWLLTCWCLTLISDARIVGDRRLLPLRCLTLVGNRTTITNWAAVIDGTLLADTGIVSCVTLIGYRTAVVMTLIRDGSAILVTFVGYMGIVACVTLVGDRTAVVVTFIRNWSTVVTGRCSGACTCGSSRTGGAGTCGCTGCVLVV
ncbi:MAG: hypothetical protein ACTH12_12965, partial [Brevibacterium aurantiacum]